MCKPSVGVIKVIVLPSMSSKSLQDSLIKEEQSAEALLTSQGETE